MVASVVVAGAIALVSAALAIALRDGSAVADTASLVARSGEYRGSEPPPGIAMRDFSIRSVDGRVVDSTDLTGRVTVLTFLYSQCTESCPVIAWTVARTIDALTPAERQDVRAVAISTDPAEDTAQSVRSFLARNRAAGRLLYVGGAQPERELRAAWDAFDVLSSLESGQDALHSAPVRIYDRSGAWVSTLHAGVDLTESNLAHDIRVAMSER